MTESKTLDSLFKALSAFHDRSPLVKASKENPFHKNKYADYNAIVSATRGHLREQGLVVKQTLTHIDGILAVRTLLRHNSGEFIEDVAPVAYKPTDPQAQGSGVTYMKRYSYVAMLDLLVDADDDGNLGSQLGKTAEKNQRVEAAISHITNATSSDELKTTFLGLPADMKRDKRVIAAKDARKAELDI